MGRILVLTESQLDFIKSNWDKMSGKKIGKAIGISATVIRRVYKEMNIVVTPELSLLFKSKSLSARTTRTPEQDEFIQKWYLLMPTKAIAKKLGISDCGVRIRLKKLGLVVPRELRDKWIAESRFKKGQVSFNKGLKWDDFMSKESQERSRKTTYKNGSLPHNTYAKVGTVSIRAKTDGSERYKYVCVSVNPYKWRLLHQVIWERAYGPIPKGEGLWFKDGDSMNCVLENLECITRAENLRRNNLTDNAIASRMCLVGRGKRDEALKNEILNNHPELIEVKRLERMLQHEIRTTNDGK